MARRKKHQRSFAGKRPECFVFTEETIALTQRALMLFEQPLHQADHRNEKVAFAEETMQSVKHKLEQMKQSVGLLCLTTFDYNEKIIIRQAILLYSIDLLEASPEAQQAWELRQSRRISMYFSGEGKALP